LSSRHNQRCYWWTHIASRYWTPDTDSEHGAQTGIGDQSGCVNGSSRSQSSIVICWSNRTTL